jgi:hypothetical protein
MFDRNTYVHFHVSNILHMHPQGVNHNRNLEDRAVLPYHSKNPGWALIHGTSPEI